MSMLKVDNYEHINDVFYDTVTTPNPYARLEYEELTLFNDQDKILIELDQIFIFNMLKICVDDRHYIEYKIETAESFKNFFNTFCGRYPYIIEAERKNLYETIRFFYESLCRYDRNKNFVYCEDSERGFVNLIFDDQFLKIDRHTNPRILSLHNSKISLFSLMPEDLMIKQYLENIFDILELKKW